MPGNGDLGIGKRADGGGHDVVPKRSERGLGGGVGAVSVDRDGDVRHGAGRVHVHRDRLVHAARGERAPLELGDGLLYLGGVDARCFDNDLGRDLAPREGRLDPVVGLDRRQVLRVRLDPGLNRTQLERRHGEGDQEPGREPCEEEGTAKDAGDDPAPEPAASLVAAEAADQGDAAPFDAVAER